MFSFATVLTQNFLMTERMSPFHAAQIWCGFGNKEELKGDMLKALTRCCIDVCTAESIDSLISWTTEYESCYMDCFIRSNCDSVPYHLIISKMADVRNIASSLLHVSTFEYDEWTVSRADLLKLAGIRNEKPSFLFPNIETNQAQESKPSKSSTYTTPLMELMQDAAAEFWEGIDPKSSHAPTNDNVSDWIFSEMKKRGLNQSRNISKPMATILRHPDKPK